MFKWNCSWFYSQMIRSLNVQLCFIQVVITSVLVFTYVLSSGEAYRPDNVHFSATTDIGSGHFYERIYGVALYACVDLCKRRKYCHAINYGRRFEECSILDVSAVIGTRTQHQGEVTGIKSEWDMTDYDKCSKCSDKEECSITTDGVQCHVQACGPPSIPGNASVLGNIYSVGSRLILVCDENYRMASNVTSTDRTTITCQSDGSWAPADVTCGAATQWTLVFRGTSGIGTDVYAAWLHGTGTTSTDVNCMQLGSSTCTQHYRNTIVNNWSTLNVKKVRVSYYRNGAEEAFVVFTGTADLESWFDSSKMIDSSWTDMAGRTYNYFSVAGHLPSRHFFINVSYGGCGGDVVYTVTVNSNGHPCPYDTQPSYPQFLYSRLNVATSDNSPDFVKADFIAISIQT